MIKNIFFFFILTVFSVCVVIGSPADGSVSSQSNQTNQEYNNEMKSDRDEFIQEQKKAKEEMEREQEQNKNEIKAENKAMDAEMEAENQQIKAEMEAERQEMIKEFKTEREAMKALWTHRQSSTSINQQFYDITSHTNIDFNE
jgi:flagellar biosynthesis GTPase FlhF